MLDLKNSTYSDVRPRQRTLLHRLELWMINDGKMYLYLGFWILIQSLLYSLAAVNYRYYPLWQNMHELLGGSFIAARSAALVLHVNTALVLLPVCRTVISWIRTTPLNRVIPFDHALLFHKLVGYSILLFALVHTGAHYRNYYVVSQVTGVPYWRILFTTGHSITGHLMLFCMIIMGVTGYAKIRQKHFNLFWNLHHLYVLYFACFSIHGGFCLLKSNLPPFCSTGAAFWKYWVASGVIYLFERLSREFRANWRAKDMKVQKVILHPGKVIEVQFRKPRGFKGQAGQYAFLCCPAVSTQQWHPFTLTSAPEEDYVSVHVRVVGDWTKSFSEALGAKEEHWKALEISLASGNADAEPRNARKPKKPLADSQAIRDAGVLPAPGAPGSAYALGRDSMAYSPLSAARGNRERRNTGLSSSRRNTMLLVDRSDGSGLENMTNYFSSQHQNQHASLTSRLSQYVTGSQRPTTSSDRMRSRSSANTGHPAAPNHHHYLNNRGSIGDGASKVPTLKQLQDEYLLEAQLGSSVRPSGSGSTAVADDMQELHAIVNGDKDEEWESMPMGVISNRLGAPASLQPSIVPHQTANILPQVLVDGPFGSASEDVFNHEIAMLFCAGIGCTPFASVLKSIWYRLSYPEGSFRLRKVYFFWTQRDTKSFEWFQDLLKAIEEEDEARLEMDHDIGSYSLGRPSVGQDESMIEIHTYLTGKLNFTQMTHIHLNVGDVDPITGLRSPTKFGRPNLDLIFRAVAHEHPATDVGVFFCGPHKMGSTIGSAAKKWSSKGQDGTKFYYNKENF
ncbi:hypothetical protein LPJ66_002410 [Kickxella alabastrina]|uniref:Uncharacterized protein n=1 Tax=Kickxella alabastrina TaxID=61397 RepID=A0ACC1IQG2_9FUNG|nr:hypothetical protein LPJ66_002410 [Kickxella alabastrina]